MTAQPDNTVRLALVRHGETDWNREHRWQGRTGADLNAAGRDHATLAAGALRGGSWSWILASPAPRAQTTGWLIAEALGLDAPALDDELVECDFGAAEGMHVDIARERWPSGEFPGMETGSALRLRGATALNRIAGSCTSGGVLVSHGRFIRAAVAELCNEDLGVIANGSVTILSRNDDGWMLESWPERLA